MSLLLDRSVPLNLFLCCQCHSVQLPVVSRKTWNWHISEMSSRCITKYVLQYSREHVSKTRAAPGLPDYLDLTWSFMTLLMLIVNDMNCYTLHTFINHPEAEKRKIIIWKQVTIGSHLVYNRTDYRSSRVLSLPRLDCSAWVGSAGPLLMRCWWWERSRLDPSWVGSFLSVCCINCTFPFLPSSIASYSSYS